jgi:membrane protease YdiL (CAAX protease family)
MTANTGTEAIAAPNWRHVGAFLGLTFGLTYLLDLAVYLRGGLSIPGTTTVIQLQMLLPAFSAILLSLLFFDESPLHHSQPAGRGRWFYYYFIFLTLVFAFSILAMWLAPSQGTLTLAGLIIQVLAFLGLLVLIGLRLSAGREAMARVWLTWGKGRYYLFFGLGIIAFYVLQVLLNMPFGLGPVQPSLTPAPPGLSPAPFVILAGVQSVLLAPILAILIAFGEEYGWRGYLQSELFKMGRVRGVILVGVIWGAWHWPLILMGFSYPGYPVSGLVLTALFTTGMAIAFGYAVLKSGSILLAAYLHALNDQVTAYIVALGYKPFDPVFSFGIGIFGVATLAIIALLILRDPIWRGKGSLPG